MTQPEGKPYHIEESTEESIFAHDFLDNLRKEDVIPVEESESLLQYLQGYDPEEQLERVYEVYDQAKGVLVCDEDGVPGELLKEPDIPFITSNRTIYEGILVHDENGNLVDMERAIEDDNRVEAANHWHKRSKDSQEIVRVVRAIRTLVAAESLMRELDADQNER